jgi:uncharacterized protein (DUF169 family)
MTADMSKQWKQYAVRIKEVLDLRGSPVAVTYSLDAPAGAAEGKFRVCDAFIKARDGKVIDITVSSSACSGGTWHLGLGPQPTGEAARGLKDFLVEGEKLFCSVGSFHRIQSLSTAPPLGVADHVVLAPLDKAELRPDLVLFVCNAEQGCRLVQLDMYETGIPPKLDMSGSTCHQVIGYPLVSGELNVSLMDFTSRRIKGYGPGDLLVSIPYHRLHGVMRSIDYCTAGTAKMEVPDTFRRQAGGATLEGLE